MLSHVGAHTKRREKLKIMTINGLNIENIYFIKNGVIVLSSNYKDESEKVSTFYKFIDDLKSIDYDFKKATLKTFEKLIKENKSFYMSTNKRDYDNTIIYNLYIAEDVATLEQLEDIEKKSYYQTGVTDYQKQFKITFKYDLIFLPLEWVAITKNKYNELIEKYNNWGYWQSRNELMQHTFEYMTKEIEEDIEKNGDFKSLKSKRLQKYKDFVNDGFYAFNYERVEHRKKEVIILSHVYKHTKDKFAKNTDKITEIMKEKVNDNISVYDVEKMLKYFDIKIKK